ncbi:AMP-binding protein [Actinospica robiniae]|uniref:AMP-binding protein n=1 Tax=Actinospica robiniae TaxID=304901 RepID=UPI0003FBC412
MTTPESVHRLFVDCARRTPEAVAVRAGEDRLTYAQLDARSDDVARLLARAAGPGDVPGHAPVAVLMNRSTTSIAVLLGILKAGRAYLALDPRDPDGRLAALLHDAGVELVICGQEHLGRVPAPIRELLPPEPSDVDEPQAPPTRVEHPGRTAYIAYTSGSTGSPRGVCVPHRAVLRLAQDPDYIDVRPDDVFLHAAPTAFDASTFEIWVPLLHGAAVVPAPLPDLSPVELIELARREGVTVWFLTTGLFHQVVDAGLADLPALRYLLTGGDVLSVPHVNRAFAALPAARLIAAYGPTENTTYTTCHPVSAPVEQGTVPI